MDLECFYESMGVDYSRVLNRLRKEQLIEKYLHLVVKDENFSVLKKAVEDKDTEAAFRAVHSIKGIALNLDLEPLAGAASVLAEYLRGKSGTEPDWDKAQVFYHAVEEEFTKIKEKIN